MNAPAPQLQAEPQAAAGDAGEVRTAARAGARALFGLAADLLLAGGRTLGQAQRDERLAAARASWPAAIEAVEAIARLTPAAADLGWLADAELMDRVEQLTPRPPGMYEPLIATAGGFATLMMTQLIEIGRAETRAEIRARLEFAFEVWPKLCRRMGRLGV